MCPWLSGEKCLRCSTARVKAPLLFFADCTQRERQFRNKSVPGFSTRMSSWRKKFQSKWKIPPSTKHFISLWGTCDEKERGFCLPSAQELHHWTFGRAEGDLLTQTHCLPDWKQGFSTSSLFYPRLCPHLLDSVFPDLSSPFSPDEAFLLAKTN